MLYWRRPSPAELALTPWRTADDYVEPDCEVWDEHWDSIQLFARYSTQWRTGMNGVVAFDYAIIQHDMYRRGVSNDEYERIIDDFSVIESQALYHLTKK